MGQGAAQRRLPLRLGQEVQALPRKVPLTRTPTEAPVLCTLGYEGADIGGFIETLKHNGVAGVIDVRAVPSSRKPGFSMQALQAHLQAAGIGYRHLPGLGNPKAGRKAAAAGDVEGYLEIMHAALDSADGRRALAAAAALARVAPSCLLCLEADPSRCHRSVVAERLAADGFAVRHLRLDGQHGLPF